MKLKKRNLLTAKDLPSQGEVVTIVNFIEAQTDFYAYELIVIRPKVGEAVIGLQKQSFNINSLIEILGDDTEAYKGKKLTLTPTEWNDTPVIRFSAAKQ
jgi:hypothetical protein